MDEEATGLFSSAVRPVEALKFGHYAVLGALLPILSRGAMDSRRNLQFGFRTVLALSLLLAFGVTFLAHPLVLLLYGTEFEPAATLLSLLGWTLLPYTVSAFISVDMVSRGMENTLVKTMLVTLAIFTVLYFWLIRSYGILGAPWAALVGEVLQAFILLIVSPRKMKIFSLLYDTSTRIQRTGE
jgi:O-antigen/teichoic acid export membrane protein